MMKSPAMEAEYAHDERTPLSLYDCLIPKLRENRMLYPRKNLTAIELHEDYRAKVEAIKLEN